MTTSHFTGGEMPHTPIRRLDEGLYEGVEKNIVYACTDVALRDPSTGRLFLGLRQTQPQIGPWFIGGRNAYAKSVEQNAAMQVENDLGVLLPESRFQHIATYSTDFPIASPGREDHGRHTMNATMLADLTPDEVSELNERVAGGDIRDEYSSGGWYDIDEIADPESDYPWALKQFVRDMYAYDVGRRALHELALLENELFDTRKRNDKKDSEKRRRIIELEERFGIALEKATEIERLAGPNSAYSVVWARTAEKQFSGDGLELAAQLQALVANTKYGDFNIMAELRRLHLPTPEVYADNGPTLRAILNGAIEVLKLNHEQDGALFGNMHSLEILGHPGPHPQELL